MRSLRHDDGLGQGLFTEFRWWWRWLRLRRSVIHWRRATGQEEAWVTAHPQIGDFGDFTEAVAEFEGRRLIVCERIWAGWPDPPTYAVFALEGDDIWAAWDFHEWPQAWNAPFRTVDRLHDDNAR